MFVMPVPSPGVLGERVEGDVELEVTEVMEELEGEESDPFGESMDTSDDNLSTKNIYQMMI